MTKFSAKLLTVSVLGSLCVLESYAQVNPAQSAADLSEAEGIAVQTSADLAQAALAQNSEEINEAMTRSDAVAAAVAQAREAYLAMERALLGGDEDAAASYAAELKECLANAIDAANGVIPDAIADTIEHNRLENQNTGTLGRPGDPVNVYENPWNSDRMKAFYQNHFANMYESGVYPWDRETTPE